MKRFKTIRTALVVLACAAPALAVRAAAPAGRYTISGGTVLDTKTKLTWQQALAPSTMTLAAAKTYCAGLGATLGGSGWRVPAIKELWTLVDDSATRGPTIDTTYFPNTPSAAFLSSTAPSNDPSYVWVILFATGTDGVVQSTGSSWVRCVR